MGMFIQEARRTTGPELYPPTPITRSGFMRRRRTKDFIKDKNKFNKLIHPEDQKYIKQKFEDWEKSGKKDLLTLWFRVQKSDGSYMWVEDRMVEVIPENEKNIMLV